MGFLIRLLRIYFLVKKECKISLARHRSIYKKLDNFFLLHIQGVRNPLHYSYMYLIDCSNHLSSIFMFGSHRNARSANLQALGTMILCEKIRSHGLCMVSDGDGSNCSREQIKRFLCKWLLCAWLRFDVALIDKSIGLYDRKWLPSPIMQFEYSKSKAQDSTQKP